MNGRFLIPMAVAGLAVVVTLLPAAQPPATRPAEQEADQTARQLDFARRPISYFNEHCASCHGQYGSFWLDEPSGWTDRAKLRRVVEEMAAGPAFEPLEGPALEAQTAYHLSLADGRPFISVHAAADGTLRGEVTPRSEVVLIAGEAEHRAKVEGHAWQSDLKSARLVRVRNESERTELALPEELGPSGMHSHRE